MPPGRVEQLDDPVFERLDSFIEGDRALLGGCYSEEVRFSFGDRVLQVSLSEDITMGWPTDADIADIENLEYIRESRMWRNRSGTWELIGSNAITYETSYKYEDVPLSIYYAENGSYNEEPIEPPHYIQVRCDPYDGKQISELEDFLAPIMQIAPPDSATDGEVDQTVADVMTYLRM